MSEAESVNLPSSLTGIGHPQELFNRLVGRIQGEAISRFQVVEAAWLELMWAIDAYRIQGVPPIGMGKEKLDPSARLAGIYRSKGNWFATVLAALLQNQTSQPIRPRIKVQGFSQLHQIDLAWPDRQENPLVCVETKVTGAPAYLRVPQRSPTSDFANRRKEIKFSATDLKLWRRKHETAIEHWQVWKEHEAPKTYFLWAARLKTAPNPDDLGKLIREVQALVHSYLDGAGIFAWREDANRSSYESVPVPAAAQVFSLDDVLYRIASEIRANLTPAGLPPPPVQSVPPIIEPGRLLPDTNRD